jgi:hypothetical protein
VEFQCVVGDTVPLVAPDGVVDAPRFHRFHAVLDLGLRRPVPRCVLLRRWPSWTRSSRAPTTSLVALPAMARSSKSGGIFCKRQRGGGAALSQWRGGGAARARWRGEGAARARWRGGGAAARGGAAVARPALGERSACVWAR